jgi:hypothetical protein
MKGVFLVMKLRPVKRTELKKSVTPQEEQPKKREKKENKLPPDGYRPMFPPMRFLVREYPSFKNPEKINRDYIEMSVKRFDDDEAPACVFVQMYRESEAYTGYLKGKTVHFPISALGDVLENLESVSDKCEELNIEF